MPLITKPTDISKVWASTGDKREPDDTKKALGFIEEIPTYQDFNWLFNKIDQMAAHCNQLGIPQWDNETEYQANKSYVQGSDGSVYFAKQTNSNNNPVGDTSNWVCVLVPPAVTKPAKPEVDLTASGGWAVVDAFKASVSDGLLYVTGSLSGGSGTATVATLPVGYRPSQNNQLFAIQTNSGGTTFNPVGVVIATSGAINLTGATHGGDLRLMLVARM